MQETTAHKTLDDLEAAIDTFDFECALQLCQTLIQLIQLTQLTQLNEITKTNEEL